MPRRSRIEIAGYQHIINRSVEQRVVFKEASDYEYFEELICFYMKYKSIGYISACCERCDKEELSLSPDHYTSYT